MSDDYHRPTYTSADQNNYPTNAEGRYNPTQVRLYGIPGLIPEIYGSGSIEISTARDRPSIKIDLSDPEQAKKDVTKINELLDALARDPKKDFVAQVKQNWRDAKSMPLPGYFLNLTTQVVGTVFVGMWKKDKPLSSGIMFGYAYEGHTYDFPKPKIMLVPSLPLVDPKIPANAPPRPADDSGYDAKYSEGYRVWIVDKLDHCVELEVNQGFVEQLVLDANLPGKRSPMQYRAAMALAHRGGRLSE